MASSLRWFTFTVNFTQPRVTWKEGLGEELPRSRWPVKDFDLIELVEVEMSSLKVDSTIPQVRPWTMIEKSSCTWSSWIWVWRNWLLWLPALTFLQWQTIICKNSQANKLFLLHVAFCQDNYSNRNGIRGLVEIESGHQVVLWELMSSHHPLS